MPPFDVKTLSADALLKVICDGKEDKFAPLPLNDVAVITPALPNFILLPTSI